MYVIEINNFQKPYEDDTGVTNIVSALTASIATPINDLQIELSREHFGLPILFQEDIIEKDDKGDYRPLLQIDQTMTF